jgi:hypothetical protein
VQFDSMLRTLGLDELAEEKRAEVLLQMGASEVAPEFRSILLGAQERLARLTPAAGEEPPKTKQPAEPASGHSGDRERRMRRMRLMASKAGLQV